MKLEFLRGLSGDFELGRVYLGIGGLLSMFAPIGFEAWDMTRNGAHFDVTAWCLAYPGGLGALGGLGLFGIGSKEKSIASAKVNMAQNQDSKEV